MKKISLRIIAMVLLGVIVISNNIICMASSTTELNNQKQENNKEISNVQDQIEEVEQEKSETVAEVEEIENQITSYETQISELESKISTLSTQISENEEKLKQAEEDYTKQEELLEARLVATYEAGDMSYLDVLLSSESITDLISNYYLVTELATYDTEILEKIQNQKEEIQKTKESLESDKRELTTSKASLQSVSTQLKTAKSEKNKKIENLSETEKELQTKIDELKQANVSIDAEIKKVQEQIAAELAAKQKSASSSSSTSTSTSGTSSTGWIRPVNSSVTTGMYYSSGQYHGAVDFGASGISGSPVYAVADGIVVTAQALTTSYGNYVIIAHYNGLYTLYAHGQAGSITVSAGQTVTQGQQIMSVGSTGNSTGPHLHFEVRTSPGLYANRVNPLNYIP